VVAAAVLAGALLGQVLVLLTVFTGLQEVSFRWVGLAGVALPVATCLAAVGTLAGVVVAHLAPSGRRRAVLLVGGVLAGWAVVVVLAAPTLGGIVAPRPAGDGQEFTLLTQNLWYQHPDPDSMASAVMSRDADVLVLVEYTPAHRAALRAAGVLEEYPHRWEEPGELGGGLAVMSRFPFDRVERLPTWSGAVRVELRLDEGPVALYAVHPVAPSNLYGLRRWTSDYRTLTAALRDAPPATIVAGDFNATGAHRRLRKLMAVGGLVDAQDVAGEGFGATWPGSRRLPPVMRLDRVLVGDAVGVVGVELHDAAGSDHRGVEARLRFPRS
jgi:endonuclease/exonuclease/phosphatase (EEP) superfamily protein YafD